MKNETLLLIKYIVSIYLLSIIFYTVIQKIHKFLYTPVSKKKYQKNINRCSNKKFNKGKSSSKNKNGSKNRRLSSAERKRIQEKYNLLS